MSNFESALGSKNFSGSKYREIDVPDESMEHDQSDVDFQEFERQIKADREYKRTGKERISVGAKSRIEKLIGLTKTSRTTSIMLDGNPTDFTLESLNAKEARLAITEAYKFENNFQVTYELRKQFLARSLISIAGVSVEQFLSSNSLQDRLDFLDQLDDGFLNKLYGEYLILKDEVDQKFKVNKENSEEIVEDIKK